MTTTSRNLARLCLASAATLILSGSLLGAAHAASPPTCFGQPATIVGTDRDDTIVGTSGDDVIDAGAGNDTISGGGGDDLICGRDGSDTIYGGPGNDDINGGRDRLYDGELGLYIGDTIDGGIGNDYIDPGLETRRHVYDGDGDTVSYATATGTVHVNAAIGRVDARAGGRGADTVVRTGEVGYVGSAHDDTMRGGSEQDSFDGGGGSDELVGGDGSDYLVDGDSASSGPDDTDVFSGGDGRDYLTTSGGGRDTLYAGAGNDYLTLDRLSSAQVLAGEGDDEIHAGIVAGHDQSFDGGAGRDYFVAQGDGLGSRPLAIDLEAQTLTVDTGPGKQVDAFSGFEQADAFIAGELTIAGTDASEHLGSGSEAGSERLIGRGGDDVLSGTSGDDVLRGGPGSDRAYPGGGHDRCVSVEKTDAGDRCEINN